MQILLDHVVIAVSDWERSNAIEWSKAANRSQSGRSPLADTPPTLPRSESFD
jgi:hypothetical protein